MSVDFYIYINSNLPYSTAASLFQAGIKELEEIFKKIEISLGFMLPYVKHVNKWFDKKGSGHYSYTRDQVTGNIIQGFDIFWEFTPLICCSSLASHPSIEVWIHIMVHHKYFCFCHVLRAHVYGCYIIGWKGWRNNQEDSSRAGREVSS